MNRHVRARHPNIYKTEVGVKIDSDSDITTEVDIPVSQSSPQIKEEDSSVIVEETDMDDAYYEALGQKQRRSWVWSYFTRVSKTLAQCKLCNRNICHGGNATGNMNRHLKMVHHKTGEDNSWVWKVFDSIEDDFYSCKICQYKCMKFEDMERSVNCILEHLKMEHGVVSGDQIVIDSDF
ncbi:hypothetical protein RR48_05211 [Papilio machaon]|uniref:BED-type domain-containing protein n=1 Tax=Papilio machaon TaxID=76193 RepID=A0A0N1I731_PAPMA|nr:hypothetical protein RR48_05211 [Papilio machaon]